MAFATPVFHASRGYGSKVGTALMLCLALWCSLNRRYAAGMVCVSAAALFRPVTLCFAAAWIVLLWSQPTAAWVKCALAFAAGVGALAVLNSLRYGSAFVTGYGGEDGFDLQWIGLAGLLFSPGRSIILFLPICLFLIPQAARAVRGRESFDIAALVGAGVFFVAHAAWREWHAGWAYGPRLLIPIVPVVVLLVAPCLFQRRAMPLVLIGTFLQLITLAPSPIQVHDARIAAGTVSFGDTIWSLGANIAGLQTRAVGTQVGIPVAAAVGCAFAALAVLWVLERRAAREMALTAAPPA